MYLIINLRFHTVLNIQSVPGVKVNISRFNSRVKTVDSIAGKLDLVGEQNVTNHRGVRINPTAQFQPGTHVRRFKMLNALDVVRIHSFCV
jgi:hypothetical protein